MSSQLFGEDFSLVDLIINILRVVIIVADCRTVCTIQF